MLRLRAPVRTSTMPTRVPPGTRRASRTVAASTQPMPSAPPGMLRVASLPPANGSREKRRSPLGTRRERRTCDPSGDMPAFTSVDVVKRRRASGNFPLSASARSMVQRLKSGAPSSITSVAPSAVTLKLLKLPESSVSCRSASLPV